MWGRALDVVEMPVSRSMKMIQTSQTLHVWNLECVAMANDLSMEYLQPKINTAFMMFELELT